MVAVQFTGQVGGSTRAAAQGAEDAEVVGRQENHGVLVAGGQAVEEGAPAEDEIAATFIGFGHDATELLADELFDVLDAVERNLADGDEAANAVAAISVKANRASIRIFFISIYLLTDRAFADPYIYISQQVVSVTIG